MKGRTRSTKKRKEKGNTGTKPSESGVICAVSSFVACLLGVSYSFRGFIRARKHTYAKQHTHTLSLFLCHFFSVARLCCSATIGAEVQVADVCGKKCAKCGLNGKQISVKSHGVSIANLYTIGNWREHTVAAVHRHYFPTDCHSFSAQCFALFSFRLLSFVFISLLFRC